MNFTSFKNWLNEENTTSNMLYHSTDILNAINIIKDNEIKTYENVLKKYNENPKDWYDDPEYGKYIYASDFMHNSNNYYGLGDLEVTFLIDKNKIKNKMSQADRSYEGGTIPIKGNIPLKYIYKVILHKNNNELVNLLKENNIKYEIH